MAGIREVAELAGVSKSTVSIVINGKSEERKIPKETQEKVLRAVKKLNYQINLSAKRMRVPDTRKTIALYWTTDFRDIMLARFLKGVQQQIKESDLAYDVIIYPYENNMLSKEDSLISVSSFHGALIANAGEEDLKFLSTTKPMVPVVLYNRILENLSSVYVDDSVIAREAFSLLKNKGKIAIVKAPHAFEGMKIRDNTLKNLLSQNSQEYVECDVDTNQSYDGYQIASQIDFRSTSVIYTASDMIALGIMHYCYEHHIRIPEDIEILAIGNGLTHINEFLNPSLTTIQIPIETMAAECLLMLNKQFQNPALTQKEILPNITIRDSLKIQTK